ncbi:MAG: arginase family protein [Chloroflexi bacterium]|nr:arginase family protein [Chloroflexota bacterium]
MDLHAPESGFLGAPVVTDPSTVEADVAILGAPHGVPYPHPGATVGCSEAPAAVRVRSQRLARFRGHHDFDTDGPMLPLDSGPRLVDVGDISGHPTDGAGNSSRITEAVAALLARGAVPVCIGGDDSVPIPMLRAFAAHGPITVLQVDAHLDFRDEVDGIREGYSSPMRRASEMEHVARIAQVGLRGVGSARPADVDDARAAGNVLVTARELRERGVEFVLDELRGDDRIVLSFDCDGLDPSVMPAVSAPAPGGLRYEEASDLVRGVAPRLVGAVFTEYVPGLDRDALCALVVTRLMIAALSGLGRRS